MYALLLCLMLFCPGTQTVIHFQCPIGCRGKYNTPAAVYEKYVRKSYGTNTVSQLVPLLGAGEPPPGKDRRMRYHGRSCGGQRYCCLPPALFFCSCVLVKQIKSTVVPLLHRAVRPVLPASVWKSRTARAHVRSLL
jgi:hypothetical protein